MKLLELQVLYALREHENFKKLRGFIDDQFFSTPETTAVYAALVAHHDKYQRTPDWAELRTLLYERVVESEKKKAYRKLLRRIDNSPIGVDLALDLVRKGRTKQKVREIVQDLIPLLDSPDDIPLEKIRMDLAEAAEDSKREEVYDYLHAQRKYYDPEEAVPTGLDKLDSILCGGLYPAEFGEVAGAPEDGKTLFLINMAVAPLTLGKKTYFFSLDETGEDIAKRFDCRLTGRTAEELRTSKDSLKLPKYAQHLTIIDKASGCRIEDITGFCYRFGVPDVLFIDGGDLLLAPRREQRRFELGDIYTSYLRLSRMFRIPVWVSTYATIQSLDRPRKKMGDLSEGKLAKSGPATVILMVSRTEDDTVRIVNVAKARRPPGARSLQAQIDTARQRINSTQVNIHIDTSEDADEDDE